MLEFLTEAIRNFRHTGSVGPSSPILAKAMTSTIARIEGQRRILEVGPGTGPFTKSILSKLRAGDHFELVEINQNFCRKLEKDMLAGYRTRHPNVAVRLHCARHGGKVGGRALGREKHLLRKGAPVGRD